MYTDTPSYRGYRYLREAISHAMPSTFQADVTRWIALLDELEQITPGGSSRSWGHH